MTNTEDIKIKLSNSISFKLGVILLLVLLIQIPLSYVDGLIFERQQMQNIAQREISVRWGDDQYIGTPFVTIYSSNIHILNSANASQNTLPQISHNIQSESSKINIKLDAEKRYLGIYEAAVYNSNIQLSGTINLDKTALEANTKLNLFIPIKHITSIKKLGKLIINGESLASSPQQKTINNIFGFEVSIQNHSNDKVINYEIEFSLSGSRQFEILPLARETIVDMKSNWNSPSFIGNYLPYTRKINEDGFSATWNITNIVQNMSKSNLNSIHHDNTSFGVKIFIPANIYQVNERTVKYSFLIVLLTFAGFFLAELFFKLRLHPFQYLLIGVSLSVFYLLLLSLSEYLLFNWAFLISASAVIVLIGGYCTVVLQQRSRGLYTGLLFALLYGFIFILVKAEQTSLLMGAIGIWIILAIIMYLTRKIDWYAVNIDKNKKD